MLELHGLASRLVEARTQRHHLGHQLLPLAPRAGRILLHRVHERLQLIGRIRELGRQMLLVLADGIDAATDLNLRRRERFAQRLYVPVLPLEQPTCRRIVDERVVAKAHAVSEQPERRRALLHVAGYHTAQKQPARIPAHRLAEQQRAARKRQRLGGRCAQDGAQSRGEWVAQAAHLDVGEH